MAKRADKRNAPSLTNGEEPEEATMEVPTPEEATMEDPAPANTHVFMQFPRAVRIAHDEGHGTHQFHKGLNNVPIGLKDHWWLKANGAKET